MANTLIFDFLHYYRMGERRNAGNIAYQWDQGHVLEAYLPSYGNYQIHYYKIGMSVSECYAVSSIEAVDEGYLITARIPNTYFETRDDLIVFIVSATEDELKTTYEGVIHIRNRPEPDDYVDDDPENSAEDLYGTVLAYATAAEAWAVGTMSGVDVGSDADQYQNNAKYYAELSALNQKKAKDALDVVEQAIPLIEEFEERLSLIEHMVISDDITAPITDDDGALLVLDDGTAIVADWSHAHA